MRHLYLLLFLVISIAAKAQQKRKVLFLGNSYTYENNMPQILVNIAANRGDTLLFDMHAPGGFTLNQHGTSSTTLSKLKAGGWDYVILQEQSQLPSWDNYTPSSAVELYHLVRETNPCSKLMYYMTWGRKNGDQQNCSWWPPVCTYKGMDSMLRLRYIEMAEETHSPIAAVSAAWRYVRENYPSIELYQADGSHPSAAGSYLAACTFYTSIFKKDPAAITYDFGLNTITAASIRFAVKKAVFDSLSTWDYSKPNPEANFELQIGKGTNEIILHNHSLRADSFRWDFGDGTIQTYKNTVYNYATHGQYKVRLIVFNCELGVLYSDTMDRMVSFCPYNLRIYPEDLVLCPPYDDTIWTQEYDTYQWFRNGDTLHGETNRYFVAYPGDYSVAVSKDGCSELSTAVTVSTHHSMQTYFTDMSGPLIGPDKACVGDTVLMALVPNKPPYPDQSKITWYRNGMEIPASANDTIKVTQSGIYTVKLKNQFCEGFYDFVDSSFKIDFVICLVGIGEKPELLLELYPNPAHEQLIIELKSGSDQMYLITDILGKVVDRGYLNAGKNNMDISNLPKGVYMIQLPSLAQRGLRFVKD